ncbi:carbamoyltransferase C-terminal domain-containing protein [Nonomuraea sp. NPDC046802]|uniref:carbamoyltransferase C-terminal domain-containing protein n=1 Tax=Nonomuraea sp. NPDC046802 TaxID=3154919 RepID=UPI0033DFD342
MTVHSYVLGVSMSNHDRSACLVGDGRIIGAVAEERLDRRKRSEGFYRHSTRGIVLPPMRAITRLLRDEGIGFDDLELVVCGRSITECRDQFLAYVPVSPDRVVEPGIPGHHLAHGYSAYATSPHDSTAVLVIDEQGHRVGERFERCTWFVGTQGPLRPIRRFWGDSVSLSLGMFYNVFAALTGLAEAGRPAAGKLMSLAAYGGHRAEWPDLLSLSDDGDAGCDLATLDLFLAEAGVPHQPGMRGRAVRQLDDLLVKYRPIGWTSDLSYDLAHKAQGELERAVVHIAAKLRVHTDADVLAYAGGVALNCSANALLGGAGWKDVHVHPAATDDGAAVGLAMYGWIEVLGRSRPPAPRFDPRTGPRYDEREVEEALRFYGLQEHARRSDIDHVADLLAIGSVVCWYEGRSEWGPRALGARSIVANPLTPGIAERINSTIKFRESFRPFGVSLPAEVADALLDRGQAPTGLDPYMLSLARPRHPGLSDVTHIDGTLRYQLVERATQPEWHALIRAVGDRTGLPAVVNTSFNTMGEPLVESPQDAVRQFLISDADALWLNSRLIVAAQLPEQVRSDARRLAWSRSHLEVPAAAAGLASSGHPAAASELLAQHGAFEPELDSFTFDQTRLFHALCLRLAVAKGDTDVAMAHATRVLDSWVFPPEVLQAAAVLAEQDLNTSDGVIGRLLGSLGTDRSALEFFRHLLGSTAPLPTTPRV